MINIRLLSATPTTRDKRAGELNLILILFVGTNQQRFTKHRLPVLTRTHDWLEMLKMAPTTLRQIRTGSMRFPPLPGRKDDGGLRD